MPAQRIVLLTGNPLRSNPRVIKEASALAEEGCEVTVLGAWSGGRRSEIGGQMSEVSKSGASVKRCFGGEGGERMAVSGGRIAEVGERRTDVGGQPERSGGVGIDMRLAAQGGYTFVPLLPPDTIQGKLHQLVQRLARKCAPRSRWSFGLMPFALKRAAARLKPDLAVTHSEPAMLAALALHKRGVKVGVDMEDWFSEDLLPEARSRRPVDLLRRAERDLLHCAAHATCTTEAMADALVRAYACPRPTRIYNVFPTPKPGATEFRDRGANSRSLAGEPSRGRASVSIHWFSQTLGPGRGLEELISAAQGLGGEFEIHLRGERGAYRYWLEELVPDELRSRVFVHPSVPADDLPARIAEHDIGFAGELSEIPSRHLTATNKIFQYLQGGLAVVASDTAGQREVAALAGTAVVTYRSGSSSDLQEQLSELTGRAKQLAAAKAAAADIAARSFNWAEEKPRLLASVRRALDGK
jgi:glycosyltransferase involved in cell wall biosynthesis